MKARVGDIIEMSRDETIGEVTHEGPSELLPGHKVMIDVFKSEAHQSGDSVTVHRSEIARIWREKR